MLLGFPEADGILGDIGGGSLEVVDLRHGRVGDSASLPLGVIRLAERAGGDMAQATRAVEAIKRAYASQRLDTQDGVRVDFDAERAWLHVRGSNTEPIMRLIAEAPSEAVANRILDDAAAAIAGR